MTKQIELQGQIFEAVNYSEEIAFHEETQEPLIKVKFSLNLIGEEAQAEVYQLISNPFSFVLENGTMLTFKTKSHSYAYKGDDIGDQTPISYKLEFIQVLEPRISETNFPTEESFTMDDGVQFQALYELLIDKGIITEEEYRMKLQSMQK